MRVFVGGNLSEKTSLDLSMYFVNANYHVPNPNNIASYATPGADINYVDSNYSYAAPRLGFVWRPTAAVAVRAAAGGGFAEAPLGDLVGSNAPFCFGGYVHGNVAKSQPPTGEIVRFRSRYRYQAPPQYGPLVRCVPYESLWTTL